MGTSPLPKHCKPSWETALGVKLRFNRNTPGAICSGRVRLGKVNDMNEQTQQEGNEQAQPIAQEQQQAPNAYETIITQQQDQINALIAQTNALNAQITQMVQNGAQFVQQAHVTQNTAQQPIQQIPEFSSVYDGNTSPLSQFNTPALSDNTDYSLESLASEIGKRDV